MLIPYQKLMPQTLNALLETHALREGTEYGIEDVSLQTKVMQLQRQLQHGEAYILYDAVNECCTIISKAEKALLDSNTRVLNEE